MAKRPVFVDTSALHALIDSRDTWHSAAVLVSKSLRAQRRALLISDWVLTEFLGGAAKQPLRKLAVETVRRFRTVKYAEVMPASHDDWVRGVGIPHYRVKYTVKRLDSGYLVRGKLYQSSVPRGFIAPVPLFVNIGSGKPLPLGTVIASGEETSFHFVTPNAPRKILVDPQMTLLCSVE